MREEIPDKIIVYVVEKDLYAKCPNCQHARFYVEVDIAPYITDGWKCERCNMHFKVIRR